MAGLDGGGTGLDLESRSQETGSSEGDTNYAVYGSDGERKDDTSTRPEEGFYYAQDDPQGELTLYQVVGGHHVPIESWPSSGDVDYRVADDGTAYSAKETDISGEDFGSFQADGDSPASEHDIQSSDNLGDLDLWGDFGPQQGLTPENADNILELVSLPIPRGASEGLIWLITDTQDTMQEQFDSIGVGDPKSAPAFTKVLEDVGTLEGWNRVIDLANESETNVRHETLAQRMEARQELYDDKNDEVSIDVDDLTPKQEKVLADLRGIKDDLVEKLEVDLLAHYEDRDGYSMSVHDDGDIMLTISAPIGSESNTSVLFEMKEDAQSGSRYYELAPSWLHSHYIDKIIDASEEFSGTYDRAVEEFQEVSARVDDDSVGDDDGNGVVDGNDNSEEGDNGNSGERAGENGNNGNLPGMDGGTNPTPGDPFAGDGLENPEDLFGDLIDNPEEDGAGGEGDGEGQADGADEGGSGVTADMLEEIIRDLEESSSVDDAGSGGSGDADSGPVDAAAGADPGSPGPVQSLPQNNSGMGGLGDMIPASALMSGLAGNNNPWSRQEPDPRPPDLRDRDLGAEPYAPDLEPVPIPGSDMPPAVTASTNIGAPPQTFTPSGEMVDVDLRNGMSQSVPAAVAEALNKELHNPNGSDGRAAYEGTSAQAGPGSSWERVGPTPGSDDGGSRPGVQTGDVAQWEYRPTPDSAPIVRTALLVVTDEGLNVIVNGEVVPLDPNNPPDDGSGRPYGDFVGYFHPTGIDPATPGSDNTGAAAEPPPVAAAAPAAPEPPAVEAPTLR
ncbi:hypothetical protein [Nocardia mangyaensis]|uniref:hypothetical protein n=1 Tax=Nocardia mangyaensis TaxID=2213200 RepID=UPI0012EB7C80|nr:hypothetical protein [Nocardia mangyaensis]